MGSRKWPGDAAAAGIAGGVIGLATLAWILWVQRDPAALRLAPVPAVFVVISIAGAAAGLAARALVGRRRGGLACLVAPLALAALTGLARVGLLVAPSRLLWPALALLAVLIGVVAARRGGRALGWLMLAVAVGGAYAATIPPALLIGGPPPAANAIGTSGNERRLCRRLATGVVARETVSLPFAPFVRVVAAVAPEGGGVSVVELEIRTAEASWRGRVALTTAFADGFAGGILEVTDLPIGPATLDWQLSGPGDILYLAELEIFTSAPPVLIESLTPAPTVDPALCDASHGGACRVVSARGVARPAAIVWPSARIPIDAEVGQTILVPIAVPEPYWTRPVAIELFFGWDDKGAVRRTIATPARGWQSVALTVPTPDDEAEGPVLSIRGGPGMFAVGRVVRRDDRPPRRSVVLISLDTVRADHVGAYGYARPTTPHIDALAGRGVRFDDATSTSSWTLPAHASLLASRPAGDLMSFPRGRAPFAAVVPLLAEVLGAAGYDTAAFTGGGFMSRHYGFDRGFDLYGEANDKVDDAAISLDHVQRWIEERSGGPFFLLFHTFRAHGPYQGDRFVGDLPDDAGPFARAAAMYDEGIARADAAVGELLELLDAAGMLDDTLVVVLSDHGEALGERWPETAGMGHGQSLHQEVVRIPLVMAGPDLPHGTAIAETVSLLDVAPTIARFAQVAAPVGWLGRPLQPLVAGEVIEVLPILIEQFERHGVDTRAVRLGSLKVVAEAIGDRIVDVRIYDLDTDPGERAPLAVDACEVAPALIALLASRFAADRPDGAAVRLPRDVEARLRALGYVD